MHILVVPSAYPTIENTLGSIFFKEQAIHLKNRGNKVGVIFSEFRRISNLTILELKNKHFQTRVYNESGIITYRIHGWNIFTMRFSVGVNLWVKQSLYLFDKYIKEQGMPDIIHAHCGLYGGLVAKEIKRIYGIPYIITEHSSAVLTDILRSHDEKFIKSAYNDADALISVGEKLKVSMMKYTNKDITVIPNIVDMEKFNKKNKKNKKNTDEFIFITICNLKKNKNIDFLINAFNISFKGNNNIKLIILGDGEEKDELNKMIIDYEMTKQIKILGAVDRNSISSYIQKSDAFVLPSKYETFGIVYIEALACGAPIIATECGGPEDFFNEDLGYMIPLDNMDSLKQSLVDMVKYREKFDSELISEFVSSRFSVNVVMKKIEGIYGEILKRAKK